MSKEKWSLKPVEVKEEPIGKRGNTGWVTQARATIVFDSKPLMSVAGVYLREHPDGDFSITLVYIDGSRQKVG